MSLCPTPTTILVADDHPLILRGLSDLIRGDPNLEVLATCTDGLTAFEQIRKYRPAIAVVDQNMPEMSGLDILMETKAAGLPTRVEGTAVKCRSARPPSADCAEANPSPGPNSRRPP